MQVHTRRSHIIDAHAPVEMGCVVREVDGICARDNPAVQYWVSRSSDGDGLRLQRAKLWMAAMRLRWLALARTSSGEVGQVAVHLRAGIVRAGENARRASIVERLRAAVSVD